MKHLIEKLETQLDAETKSAAATGELLAQLRKYNSLCDNVSNLERQRDQLANEITELESRKSTLENLDDLRLLPAVEAAILLYETHVKKMPPDARTKLENSFLRAHGYILGSLDSWKEVATGKLRMRLPAISQIMGKAIDAIEPEIVAGLRAAEDVVMKRAPAKSEPAKLEGAKP